MIEVGKNSKIYVVAPAAFHTGGPQLLHQLVYHLRNDLKISAFMYYIPENSQNPVHPEYQKYENPYLSNIEDSHDNILIVPEIYQGIHMLKRFNSIRKIIWWLSVDNFVLSFFSPDIEKSYNFLMKKILYKLTFRSDYDKNDLIVQKILGEPDKYIEAEKLYSILSLADYHFCQSHYAYDFLIKRKVDKNTIFYLSDYIDEEFLNSELDLSIKQDIVAYNPKKGFNFTKKIIKSSENIRFIPIVNMSKKEVMETLKRVKIYIDFGNHPGKDRIPREAAISGCLVITGIRGSARFYSDLPIPDEYKFDDTDVNIPKIVEKIRDCLVNFDERIKDFEYYRMVIRDEPKKFNEDLRNIFVKI